ncbi:unnamed protein product [Rotaria sordida]|uniref:Uncharacterized protein n=1 Tax=Rotaria sordida TaxID=392033 RepID=A0A813TJH4_9BILA|nr:unnamed protein product [Rotaria sordida]CAF0801856.1 unnamed protein product [Rotaria sordida]CAF0810631.1 unnamed protein product [Rotaria sordida]CAF0838527.1 unnamed protein product [Rotaria sordida]CAF3534645.1 unnamed protein product [Rotaria sordida]
MFHLPPPPRFTLPPPPMLASDVIDRKIRFRLTCSSIRQQQHRQTTNLRLIIISCISFLIVIILLFIIIKFYRRRRSSLYDNESKPSNNVSISSSRSYETISTEHTSGYIESKYTSATTFSTNPNNVLCVYCHQERDYSNTSLTPYYHTLEIPSS